MNFRNYKLVRTIQIIYGLALLFFGLNTFLQFGPAPQFNEAATAYLTALFNTGFILPIMAIVWIITGLLFIFNKASALAAVLIFPLSLNIMLFHIFLDFSGFFIALIVFVLNLYLLYVYLDKYKPMWNK